MANRVFTASSLDGFISDREGGLDWLHTIPNLDNLDFGYAAFMDRFDAVVMGRKTFETVCEFDCDWPYTKPIFVFSNSVRALPDDYLGTAEVIGGPLTDVLADLNGTGHRELYIDRGKSTHSFLKEDLIDEMRITVLPVLLRGGSSSLETSLG